jgi:hypothetical protein
MLNIIFEITDYIAPKLKTRINLKQIIILKLFINHYFVGTDVLKFY